MTSPNNNDIQQLRQQIDLLKWEKEIIKGRGKIRELIFENDELKRKVAELEEKIRSTRSIPTIISQQDTNIEVSRPTGTEVQRRGSSAELLSKDSPSASRTSVISRQNSILAEVKNKLVMSGRRKNTINEEDEEEKFVISGPQEEKEKEEDWLEPDSPDLLFVKQEGSKVPIVKGGTLEKLIDRLVPEKYPDPEYLGQFLLTYRSFTTPEKILETLIQKFNSSAPSGSTPEQIEEFKKGQVLVRNRIINVIRTWLKKHHSYDLEFSPLLDKIEQFVEAIHKSGMKNQAQLLTDCLEKHRYNNVEFVASTPVPKSIVPTVTQQASLTLFDLDPLELARQISLIEFELFKAISPKECLNQSWMKKDKESLSPNALKLIRWSTSMSWWVGAEILRRDSPKDRAEVIKYLIKVAKSCQEVRNYNGIMEVLAGLQSSAIDRLKKSWEKLDKNTKVSQTQLTETMNHDHNFKALRDALRSATPPCIPYLGMFLTDLTFIDTGNPDMITTEKGSLINFVKLRKTANVIKQIQHFQATGYNEQVVPIIKDYLMNAMTKNYNEEEAYNLSITLEPRT